MMTPEQKAKYEALLVEAAAAVYNARAIARETFDVTNAAFANTALDAVWEARAYAVAKPLEEIID